MRTAADHLNLLPFALAKLTRNLLQADPVGDEVKLNADKVTPEDLVSRRSSYINAIAIQPRGTTPQVPAPQIPACESCAKAFNKPNGHGRAFPECIHASGHFGGACSNCKWQEHAASCSIRDPDRG